MYLSKRESIATELRIALRRRRIKVVAESFFFWIQLVSDSVSHNLCTHVRQRHTPNEKKKYW